MFTIPLYDDNPTLRTPLLTWALIAACVAVYLWQASLPGRAEQDIVYALGMIPAVLFGQAELPPRLQLVSPWTSVFTSMFLHGGWMHLIGNMLYLWIFGNNVEDAMGHGRFVVFYLVCGLAAALTQSLMSPGSTMPMIGASGAIAGILGAYLMLHPRANVRVLLVIFIYIRLLNVPAVIVLGLWFGMQLLSGWSTPVEDGGVAFWAHIGGFLAGVMLIPFFKDSDVPLFGAARSQPFQVMPASRIRHGSVPVSPRSGGPLEHEDHPRGPWE
jgi:membrane associated rhomboid family serine protease